MSLPGPSRRIIVEPLKQPEPAKAPPRREPAPSRPARKKPEKVPA
jgi:hypothetical protein